jgi:hypothetical protein
MATEQQLMEGLKRADAAGNTADAQHFANSIKEIRAKPQNTSTAPQEKPGFPKGATMSTVFADPANRRNLGKDLGSFAYGLGTGLYGMLGDVTGGAAGPTTEETQSQITKQTGFKPGSEGFATAGEWAPALAGGAALVKKGAESGVKALGKVGDFVTDISKGIKPRALLEKFENPTSISHVGETIQKKVDETLARHVKERGPKAKKLFDTYLAKGKESEGAILEDYKKSLASYYAEGVTSGKLSPEEAKAIHQAADRITGRAPDMETGKGEKVAPGIEALEKERRFWNDVAEGYDVKGAEAIPAAAAKDIAKLLEGAIKKHASKEFDAAMTGYKELSAPINKFNTALGKRVTAKAGEFLPEVAKTDPAAVPKIFFKTRRSVQELKELTGDEKFVEAAAKSHVANDLASATKAEQVTEYLQKNKDWLQEFPGLQKELTAAAKTIGRGEKAKTIGKWGAAGAVGSGVLSGAHRLFGGP